jgi:rubredoxin
MATYHEYVFTFHPCPRCRVDLPRNAKSCDFCGLVLVEEQPDQREPILTKTKRWGQIASQQKDWRAF